MIESQLYCTDGRSQHADTFHDRTSFLSSCDKVLWLIVVRHACGAGGEWQPASPKMELSCKLSWHGWVGLIGALHVKMLILISS